MQGVTAETWEIKGSRDWEKKGGRDGDTESRLSCAGLAARTNGTAKVARAFACSWCQYGMP